MKLDRWINDTIFASFYTVLPSYQNGGMVIMVIMCNETPFTQASIKRIQHPIGFEPRLGNARK